MVGQINPLPNLPVPLGIGHMVARWLAMRVGVSNINLHGRVRFAMAPLMSKLPVVGGVKVAASTYVFLSPICLYHEPATIYYYYYYYTLFQPKKARCVSAPLQ